MKMYLHVSNNQLKTSNPRSSSCLEVAAHKKLNLKTAHQITQKRKRAQRIIKNLSKAYFQYDLKLKIEI